MIKYQKKIQEASIQGKNRIGRPRKTGEGQVRSAVQDRGVRWGKVKRTAQGRHIWKGVIIKEKLVT